MVEPFIMEDIKEKMPAQDVEYGSHGSDDIESQPASGGLTRALQGRHMQMIAIGTLPFTMSPECDKIERSTSDASQVVQLVLAFSLVRDPHFKPVVPPAWYVALEKRAILGVSSTCERLC